MLPKTLKPPTIDLGLLVNTLHAQNLSFLSQFAPIYSKATLFACTQPAKLIGSRSAYFKTFADTSA